VDSNGTISPTNADSLASNGVVSRKATLRFSVGDGRGDYALYPGQGDVPLLDEVSVNGNVLDKNDTSILFGPDGGGGEITLTFKVGIEYLRFPHRTPGSVSSEVQNGVPNVVTIIPNFDVFSTSLGVLRCGSEERAPGFGPASIEFDAMSPIVLVHGWNAGPWVWGPKPAQSSVCPVNPKNASDGGQNFVQTLIDAKAPFDCSLTIDQQVDIDQGTAQLSEKLPAILKSFGARHVNLIAHSKGGLYARGFLLDNAVGDGRTRIGVISLTTLDTTHHGSVLADTVVGFKSSLFGRPADFFLRITGIEPGFIGSGLNDMTVERSGISTTDTSSLRPSSYCRIRMGTLSLRNHSTIPHRRMRTWMVTGLSASLRQILIHGLLRT
jgi:pimeloyl-ACP methyl ester carboxylesterase